MSTDTAPLTQEAMEGGRCAKSPDGTHCVHWWDTGGDADSPPEPCCHCGFNGGAS
jgi:hypothetical protein